jgi:hypothetical protein
MPEHHREYDDADVWKAIDVLRQSLSNVQANQAKDSANYEHIKESLLRLEATTTTFAEQTRTHSVEDGKQYARIDQLEKDINGVADKIRDHVENHKFWLGLTLGIPAALLALWELANHFLKK